MHFKLNIPSRVLACVSVSESERERARTSQSTRFSAIPREKTPIRIGVVVLVSFNRIMCGISAFLPATSAAAVAAAAANAVTYSNQIKTDPN